MYYSFEIYYFVNKDTDVCEMDEGLDSITIQYGGEWTASDFGPLGGVCGFNSKSIRCNNYYFKDVNYICNFIRHLKTTCYDIDYIIHSYSDDPSDTKNWVRIYGGEYSDVYKGLLSDEEKIVVDEVNA